MKRVVFPLIIAALGVIAFSLSAYGVDPPHDSANSVECVSCHSLHNAPGGSITAFAGNANLCQSCHTTGGDASNLPFDDTDQALPRWGLPPGVSPSGTSHRWDSGVSGHADPDENNTSTGTVESGGSFNGTLFKSYTITIDAGGEVGGTPAPTFDWDDTLGNGALGVSIPESGTPGVSVAITLNEGITVTFSNGAPTSFVSGNIWRVYVRPDIRTPTDAAMAARVDSNGKIECSTCHNQHSQDNAAFTGACTDDDSVCYSDSDCTSPATCSFTQFFQRIDNSTQQMCEDCHNAKVGVGSHLSLSGVGQPFEDKCFTCHVVHFAPTSDGSLTVLAQGDLCFSCHDSDGPASTDVYTQFNPSPAITMGNPPGGPIDQVHDSSLCANCHNPHTVTSSNKVMDPDPADGDNFPRDYATNNTYNGQSYESAAGGNADPTFSGGSSGSIGPAGRVLFGPGK
jgi:predicted CXXCH cytochrome family protein